MMNKLNPQDQRHLEAAQAWLELGNPNGASEELEQISPQMRGHPDVLTVRVAIFEADRKWEHAAEVSRTISEFMPENPFGFVHMAYALHELKRTKDAWNVLLPVVDKFPGEHTVFYNLACYACQLGSLQDAMQWLEKAVDLAATKEVKLMALDNPDFEPLWNDIGKI